MATPPENIRALKQDSVFELHWPDGPNHRIPFKFLRIQCPCASCIDEITGHRMLDPLAVPETVAPVQMNFVGNYAIKITWSDGHSTGLYTWDHLATIAKHWEKEFPSA